MDWIVLVGSFAAACSTISFAPQAWKIIRTRKTDDISAGMYILTVAAFAGWSIYGTALGKWPIVASNAVCFFISAFILGMKLLPERKRNAVANKVHLKR